jgi:hypothetical protein
MLKTINLIQPVYAQVETTLDDPLRGRFQTLAHIFGWALNIIIGVGWALVFIMLALGFVKYIVSRGETKATDSARQWVTYTILGGVGLFFITAIRYIIPGLLGADPDLGPASITDFFAR